METKAGVGVAVLKDNRILIGKRKGSHGSGSWSLPGGHIEPIKDKTLADAGVREVSEETGIQCRVFSPDGIREDLCAVYHQLAEDKFYVTVYLFAEYLDGPDPIVPLEPDKCEFWRWVNLTELQEIMKQEGGKPIWLPEALATYLSHRTFKASREGQT